LTGSLLSGPIHPTVRYVEVLVDLGWLLPFMG
jgi:hypothetical protein